MARMKATPVNDFYAHRRGAARGWTTDASGLSRRGETPAESKYPWDYYKIISTLEPDRLFGLWRRAAAISSGTNLSTTLDSLRS